jgi:hypothetical protein
MYSVVNDPGATSYSWTLPAGWSGTSSTNSISATPGTTGGAIGVAANNSCGTSPQRTLSITINQLPAVSIDLSSIDTLCINGSNDPLPAGTPPGGTYSGTGISAGIFSPSVAGLGTHTITYSYTDGNSCTNTASGSIFVDACTGIREFGNGFSFKVYPNPFTDKFTVAWTSTADLNVKLSVADITGKILIRVNNCTSNSEIDLSVLSRGAYLLKAETPNGAAYVKLIKQ